MELKSNFPRVLIASPTAKAKNYCFTDWIDNVMQFKYPNFDVRLFDNTQDGGKNAKYLNDVFESRYGVSDFYGKFHAHNSMELRGIKGSESLIERMAMSHNDCRGYAMNNGYDYLLHLESDVMPQHDVIEQLMSRGKKVVGAMFYRDEGRHRCLMVQRRIFCTPHNIKMLNYVANEELNLLDGNIKDVASVGLGCVLIDVRKVFSKIEFRHVDGVNMHPDSYFSEDCFRNKIPIFVDTNCIARHDNRQWGFYGVDFK